MAVASSLAPLGLLLAALAGCTAGAAPTAAGLPSWNEGPARRAITDFVEAVTDPGSPHFVAPAERIAVFDNDGTLWAEQPAYFQLLFAVDRVRELAPSHPEWREQPALAAAIDGDLQKIAAAHDVAGLMQIVMASHAGLSTEEFAAVARDWLDTWRHPKTGLRATEMVYRPMLELLAYLRTRGFQTWIVSGGGVAFLRVFAEEVYVIPPQQVIGSTIATEWAMTDDGPVIRRLPELAFLDDKEAKPLAIDRILGRRPLAAFGNSDGDLQMLQWTAAGKGRRLLGLVRHTDGDREWAYDRDSAVGRLDAALDEAAQRGWTVIDMARDWATVFRP